MLTLPNTLNGVIQIKNSISARQSWYGNHSITTKIISSGLKDCSTRKKQDASAELQVNKIKHSIVNIQQNVNIFLK